MKDKTRVGISYSWKEEREGTTAGTVDKVFSSLIAKGFDVLRDTDRIRHCQSIERYMDNLSSSDFLCIVISDTYLHSQNCLYELTRIYERIQKKEIGWFQIKILRSDQVDLFDMKYRIAVTRHWRRRSAELQATAETEHENISPSDLKMIREIERYATSVGDILSELAKHKMANSPEEFLLEVNSTLQPQKPSHAEKVRSVIEIYENLEFDVESENLPFGIHILVSKSLPGLGQARVGVIILEDENHEETRVKVQEVSGILEEHQSASRIDKGLIVVETLDGSQYTHLLSRVVELLPLNELEIQSTNFPNYLKKTARAFGEELRNISYISGKGSIRDSSGKNERRELLGFVKNWLSFESSQVLWILGDFGTGKTSFLQNLFIHITEHPHPDRNPLFIQLSKYSSKQDPEEFQSSIVAGELGRSASLSVFRKNNSTNRILLLCDGFDEMGEPTNSGSRRLNYANLLSFCEPGTKMIITCRPSYFIDEGEFENLCAIDLVEDNLPPGAMRQEKRGRKLTQTLFEPLFIKSREKATMLGTHSNIEAHLTRAIVDMSLFDENDIKTYLINRETEILERSHGIFNSLTFFDLIKQTYDLEDLASRPILLSMIVDLLPEFAHRIGPDGWRIQVARNDEVVLKQITPSALYWVQTVREFEREELKGVSRKIGTHDKRKVIESVANYLISKNLSHFDDSLLKAICQQELRVEDKDLEAFVTEIRASSFIRRAGSTYRFVHKSFLEFFAACYIASALEELSNKKGNEAELNEFLSRFEFPDGLSYFLGDLVAVAYSQLIFGLQQARVSIDNAIGRSNAINVLNCSRNWTTEYRKIQGSSLVFTRCDVDTRFDRVECTSLSFKRCGSEFRISDCSFGQVAIVGQRAGFCQISGTTIREVRIQSAEGRPTSVSFNGNSEVSSVAITGSVEMVAERSNIRFSNGSLNQRSDIVLQKCLVHLPEITDGSTERVVFSNCVITGGSLDGLSPLSFRDCTFLGPTVSNIERVSAFGGCRGFVLVNRHEDVSERGEIFLLNKYLGEKIQADFLRFKTSRGIVVGDFSEERRSEFREEFLAELNFNRRLVFSFFGKNWAKASNDLITAEISQLAKL